LARLVRSRRVGCAYANVWERQKYSTLEVDFIICADQGLDTLGLAREVIELLYDRVISRSEAWSRVLLDYRYLGRWLREFIERGEVSLPDGHRSKTIPFHIFRSPRVWVSASRTLISLKAEKHLIEEVAGEVEKLLETKLHPASTR
jgi:hypothetical protein